MKKRNKAIIITGIIILVIALIVFIVGAYLAGWDMLAWFKSQSCIWTFTLVGVYAVLVGIYLVFERWKKL